ncbi:hypothetical protein [Kitasatospora fiedleri]|uniref:hypothetical protein n=1 Tax=Kitasatospora fiedleri TaxID=2991545 RepID=UPI00249BC1C8|nr:hypothetical protein [Kitasatospora fiedleri]
MTSSFHADLPLALPADPAWADTVPPLREVLRSAAAAAYRRPRAAFAAPALTFDTAADALDAVVETVDAEDPPDTAVRLLVLPAFRIAALHEARDALHRAVGRADDAGDLLGNLELLLDDGILFPGLTPARALADLDRVLAVLDLDLPAARMLATAHLTKQTDTPAARTALAQITAAWHAAGITG